MDLLKKIMDAGVVGCGGAGFPTHVKLKGAAKTFIVNGAECEPLLRTDRYLMVHEADKLIAGIDTICRELSIPEAYIALKKTYTAEIKALTEAIDRAGSKVQLHKMDSFYPAGDEQVIVHEVTGRVVPPAGIPLDVGVIVDNVATVAAVKDAVDGIPFTEKYLTVTGEVKKPCVLKVPVGTSFAHCIELAGGTKSCGRTDGADYMVVSGGPMMGKTLSWEDAMKAQVTKTTSGILVLKKGSAIDKRRTISLKQIQNRARAACIQCSYCTQMCPRHMLGHPLEPHRIMRKMAVCTDISDILDDKDVRQAAICSECGVCEVYACPMGLAPRTINGMLKGELAKAGIRYQREKDVYEADENQSARKIATKRMAGRAGVSSYYHIENHVFLEDTPKTVTIPWKMNIGVPAQPVVSEGAFVTKGQLIGICPEGKLGANLHAGISGYVHMEEAFVTITEEPFTTTEV